MGDRAVLISRAYPRGPPRYTPPLLDFQCVRVMLGGLWWENAAEDYMGKTLV